MGQVMDKQLMELYLEYNLTVILSMSRGCSCARYLVQRKHVLFPEILKQANEEGIAPIEVFVRFAKGLHAKHSGE